MTSSRRLALLAGVAGAAAAGLGCAAQGSTPASSSASPAPPARPRQELLTQVRAAEEGFAATMARRDMTAFADFLAADAVFINGGNPLRGKLAIVEHWKKFFEPAAAPFSWRPELVEVASSGTLGYTEGPVMTPAGAVFAKFYTTWQLAPSGKWLVVFDNGYTVCKA